MLKCSKDLKFNCDVIFKDTLGNNIRNILSQKVLDRKPYLKIKTNNSNKDEHGQ